MTHVPVTPPTLPLQTRPLNPVELLTGFVRNNLGVNGPDAYEGLFFRYRMFGLESVLVNDPKAARHLLGAGAAHYRRPGTVLRVIRPIAGAGVLTSEGEVWRKQRRILAPSFTPASVELFLPHFQRAAEDLVERLKPQRRVNLARAFHEMALDAVLRTLFSEPEPQVRADLTLLAQRYLDGPGRPNAVDGVTAREEDFAWLQGSRWRFARDWARVVDAVIARRRQAGAIS